MRYREAQDRARKAEEEQTQVLRELIELRKQQDDDGEELERLSKEGKAEPALVEDARQQLKMKLHRCITWRLHVHSLQTCCNMHC